MKSRLLPITLAFALTVSLAGRASEPTSLYDSAQQALQRGVLPAAIAKLREFLAENPGDPLKRAASLDLVGALLDSGDNEGAARALYGLTGGRAEILRARLALKEQRWEDVLKLPDELKGMDGQSLRAEALVGQGRLDEAITMLHTLWPDPKAGLRMAELQLDRGKNGEAGELLKRIPAQNGLLGQWQNYLNARLILAQGKRAEAHLAFEEILRNGRHLPEAILAGATLGLADARIDLSGPETADNVIEDFISQNPDSRFLPQMFQRLNQIYEIEESPSDSLLEKWLRDPIGARTAYAEFYMAKQDLREKREDHAERQLATFIQGNSGHPLYPEALLLRGQLLMKRGAYKDALDSFEEAMRQAPDDDFRAEVEIAAGTLQFQQKEYLLAVTTFHSAAQHSSKYWEQAIYNSALAWLYQGNYTKFLDDYQGLQQRYPDSPWLAGLLLEKGLLQARSGDAGGAMDSLRDFVKQFPDHFRRSEAELAMAELAFLHDPPNYRDASQYLLAANDTSKTTAEKERADYLAFTIADSPPNRDSGTAVQKGRDFLRAYPQSAHVPEVEMKLGQILYREGDFAGAENQFESLARDYANSPLVESALFMAGQAAMQTMSADSLTHALELFEQTVKLNGPLKLYARQQQAIAQMRAGKYPEAIALYDTILNASPAPERALQSAVALGKGDALYAMGTSEAKHFAEAQDVFSQLAAQPDTGPEVHNEATYKKARCLEKLGKPDDAVAALYDVVQAQLAYTGDTPEYFWSYKAGFEAGQLLEEKQQWQSAIGIYTMLAEMAGPRSDEARKRANDIRLEHFVWDN